MRMIKAAFIILVASLVACSDAEDLLDLVIDPPERQAIDQSRVGVNNFFVDSQFGTIPQQYSEIRNTLGVRFVRVLFAWSNEVQPTPTSTPNYSFYDEILNSVPAGVDVLITVVHAPDWMQNPANWIDGDPRTTWVERWLRPTVSRYSGRGSVIGWEVWNEPDFPRVPGDNGLALTDVNNYFDLLSKSSPVVRALDPGKLIVIAATEAINQSFPEHLDYNKTLRDLGAASLVDVWNIHYYSTNFEALIVSGGIADFLNGLGMPVWITESGEQGPDQQLAYVETAWPFLREQVPSIDRIYYFQFGETTPTAVNFGLRTTDPSAPLSDLYINLRDN